MTIILCKFCNQDVIEINHELCRDFYIYLLNEKVKKVKRMLDVLLQELETL